MYWSGWLLRIREFIMFCIYIPRHCHRRCHWWLIFLLSIFPTMSQRHFIRRKKKEISESVVSLTSCANVDSVRILFLHKYFFSDVCVFMGVEMKRECMKESPYLMSNQNVDKRDESKCSERCFIYISFLSCKNKIRKEWSHIEFVILANGWFTWHCRTVSIDILDTSWTV